MNMKKCFCLFVSKRNVQFYGKELPQLILFILYFHLFGNVRLFIMMKRYNLHMLYSGFNSADLLFTVNQFHLPGPCLERYS